MPTVGIAYSPDKHRSFSRVLALTRESLEHLGGMEAFVKPAQTVLIKPDQSVPYPAEQGSTTDPLLVAALIHMAREAGAARVQVGESSVGFLDSVDCMRETGMAAVALRDGAELVDLGSSRVPNREVFLPEGKVAHNVPLPEPLLEADVIIAAPKAKNHYLDRIAGAMQGWMGVVNQQWRASNLDGDVIGRFADIMAFVRPDLCVTDALLCGEGDGPLANVPHWCGCILASTDPVGTDVTIARLMRRDENKLRFAQAGEERGLGSCVPMIWMGTPLERIDFPAWPGHEGFDYLPVNFLTGRDVTLAGTIGHVKSALDLLLRRGILDRVCTMGTPTVMLGDVGDPEFERHLQEGPYIVFDDAARPEYRNDPRVRFVPGHPVLHRALAELMQGLGVEPIEAGDSAVRRRLKRSATPPALAGLAIGRKA